MLVDRFDDITSDLFHRCLLVLTAKKEHYAKDYDRLCQFKELVGLIGKDPKDVLAGMMAKHTHSIYLLAGGTPASPDVWREKITDHINYLALLWALVVDEMDESDNTKKE
jgi:hypothetical protein